jgi:NAD-dependent deacetylase
MRRKQLFKAKPNPAHFALAELESHFEVEIVTQNIDDLHERAGSTKVTHLHGELKKVQSEKYPELVYNFEKEEISIGDLCEKGHQLRPHVVWFGEAVPMMEEAYQLATTADYFIVIGTSLNVYPAAGIINFVPPTAKCWLVDPSSNSHQLNSQWTIIQEKAGLALPKLVEKLKDNT